MTARLTEILTAKREEIERRKKSTPLESLRQSDLYPLPRRSLAGALHPDRLGIIAEVKKASPSKGTIRPEFDHMEIARKYEKGGAAAISVLTDRKFFQGDLSYLSDIRKETRVPLLMKDFMVDPYQLEEARAFGADAILLILAALDEKTFELLRTGAEEKGLEALVEVHDEREMERAIVSGARLIGVNNRDLRTFETRLETSERLGSMIPPGCAAISESGISTPAEGIRLRKLGYRGVLIGESFMRAPNPGDALAEFIKGVGTCG